MRARQLLAEGLGTALLVFFGVGTATLTFGFKATGGSISAGVVATALAFGLVLLALVYGILYGIFRSTPTYSTSMGLGANGYGSASMIGAGAGAVFAVEVILTAVFVFVILAVTRNTGNATVAGLAIGLTLALVHIVGILIDGTSVNPARSLGAAVFAGGDALSQLWVFIVAPLIGGVVAAGLYALLSVPAAEAAPADDVEPAPEERVRLRSAAWPLTKSSPLASGT